MKFIITILLLANLLIADKNIKYDIFFSKYYNDYFYIYKTFYSYKIIKAQSITESNLNPMAVSQVGAMGLMQIMPATERQLKNELKINTQKAAFNIEQSIKMGVFYDYKLFNNWKAKRELKDRYQLTFASYNAGIGHLIKAQQKCQCNDYNGIIKELPHITGIHSKETIDYVKRIFDNYEKIK